MFDPTPDPAKLAALLANGDAISGYRVWLDSFFIPFLERVGLKVIVRRAPDKYTLTIKLPVNAHSAP